jgi:aspartyl-tRNA(Asn)/glutamyl-tRNA(Gln) amidotransferase subunit A
MLTIAAARAQLDAGTATSRSLCEAALARIADPRGEGARAFTEVDRAGALAAADAADAARRAGAVPSPVAGLPVSVKDLFDVAGFVTRAGSVVLQSAAPAVRDATIVARLRAAGAVIVGKTGMTEFAFSGLGINPHYGTPRNPYDRATGRIPGGSSAGAAVSVADGMAVVAVGTDTGGSVRIPAALCGLAGFKPTQRRVPLAGAYPLSFTLDSIGPLAASVLDCAIVDAILADDNAPLAQPPASRSLRLLAPVNYVRADADADVTADFLGALDALRAAGAIVDEVPLPLLDRVPDLQVNTGIPGAEAHAWHAALLATGKARYDPHIAARIERGGTITTGEYIGLLRGRAELIAELPAAIAGYDALLWPTVAVTAPPLGELLADDTVYGRANVLILRNTSVVNVLDGCAVSIPMHAPGRPPTGLMVTGPAGTDARILATGRTIEAIVRR